MSVDLINDPQQLFKDAPQELEPEELLTWQAALIERMEHD